MRVPARRPFTMGRHLLGGTRMMVCLPLLADTGAGAVAMAGRLGGTGCDCIEWRLDHLAEATPAGVAALLPAVAGAACCPLIVTNRAATEGGARAQDEQQRLAVLLAAAATGVPALVDLELAAGAAASARLIETARASGVGIVLSSHDFAGTPPAGDLRSRLLEAQRRGADVAKLAVTPGRPEDVLRILEVGLEARRTSLDIPAIVLGMGALGSVSRLAGGLFGSDLTFAVGESASAPGQLPLALVRQYLDILANG